MSRTRLAEVMASLLGAALLVALPLAGSGSAALLDDLIATTTSTLLPDPVTSVVTPVVETVDKIAPSVLPAIAPTSPTTTSPTTTSPTTSTTMPPEDHTQPVATVAAEQPTGASDPGPSTPLANVEVKRPRASAPAAPQGSSPVAASTQIAATLPLAEALPGVLSSPVSSGPSAVAGEAAVRRELEAQFSVGGGYTRSTGLRSTAALFERLSALRLAPNQVARLMAPFPVAGRATYSDDWGLPRTGPGELARTHEGVDVFADRGTPVIASSDGTVGRMATGGLGGVSLRLVASDGTFYYYAHLDRFAPGLTDGDRVTKGRVLGFVGSTGNAAGTPAHLHYEIHPRGAAAVPPVPYLDRWLAEAGESIAMLSAAPASARSSILREELKQRATRNPIATAETDAPSSGRDLGPLRTISSNRSVGFAGLLVVLAAVAWGLRRWARLRSRPEVVNEGWVMADLAKLAAPPVDDEEAAPELVESLRR